MTVSNETKTLMWVLTGILFIGIIVTYYNLNNKHMVKNNKYTGLLLICIGFFGSVYVAVNSKEKEGFSGKLKNVGSLYI